MGSSESTGRLNGTERKEEERRQESGGGSTGARTIAIAITAGVAAVWVGTTPIAMAAGVAAAWGISRMLFNNTNTDIDTDTEEKDEERTTRRISTHGIEPTLPNLRIRTGYTDEGSNRNGDVERSMYFGSGSVPDQYAIPEGKSTKKSTIWFPPPPGGFKMNTDGGFRPAGGQYSGDFDGTLQNDAVKRPSAYAGILRNHRGECISAFRRFIGETGSLEAEIVGIVNGLELLVDRGLKGAILENDCDQAVFWIKGEKKSHQIPKENMAHCKDMIYKGRKLARENSIDIINIDRSANKCADALACLALIEQNHSVQIDLPDKVKKLVDEDKTTYSSRLKSGALLI